MLKGMKHTGVRQPDIFVKSQHLQGVKGPEGFFQPIAVPVYTEANAVILHEVSSQVNAQDFSVAIAKDAIASFLSTMFCATTAGLETMNQSDMELSCERNTTC